MTAAPRPLEGLTVVSLALNLPGPAALMRCRQMGATCVKLEPPSGDPMSFYSPAAYAQLHAGVRVAAIDLKSVAGQQQLHAELAEAHVLLTSFRPSAVRKLGLGWDELRTRHPALSHVAIVGSPGARAEEPGHDLTYLAGNDLVPGLELPATLYADMSGSLMASEAVLQAALMRARGEGVYVEVALSEAAAYLAFPRRWHMTKPAGAVGGAHAGYRVYPCGDGRVAVAALEPHFAKALCDAAGVKDGASIRTLFAPATHEAVAAFFASHSCEQLDRLAVERDLPLHTMPD